MEIIIGKNSGFCRGASYTVEKTKELLKNDKIYCLGEIVHNEDVVNKLESMGMITVNNIEDVPDNSKVIIRAHGESLETYKKAKDKNLEIIDLTCGKIKLIHKQVMDNNDKYIIIIAKPNHPETIGTKGHTTCSYIVSCEEDIDNCYNDYLNSNKKDIYIISQTTFSSHKFDELVDLIKKKFNNTNIIINKSICDATEKRQQEVVDLSKKVNLMIIIGGKHSSNTKELYNLAIINCSNTHLIQNDNDLNFDIYDDMIIGIMAGASTSNETVENVINELQNRVIKRHIL